MLASPRYRATFATWTPCNEKGGNWLQFLEPVLLEIPNLSHNPLPPKSLQIDRPTLSFHIVRTRVKSLLWTCDIPLPIDSNQWHFLVRDSRLIIREISIHDDKRVMLTLDHPKFIQELVQSLIEINHKSTHFSKFIHSIDPIRSNELHDTLKRDHSNQELEEAAYKDSIEIDLKPLEINSSFSQQAYYKESPYKRVKEKEVSGNEVDLVKRIGKELNPFQSQKDKDENDENNENNENKNGQFLSVQTQKDQLFPIPFPIETTPLIEKDSSFIDVMHSIWDNWEDQSTKFQRYLLPEE